MIKRIIFIAAVFMLFGAAAFAHEGAHDYRYVPVSPESHARVCVTDGCGEREPGTSPEAHAGGTATCQRKAVCAVCGARYGKRLAHDFFISEELAPGCMTPGSVTRICRVCCKREADIVPQTGHYYGDWLPVGDGTHSAECVRCGESAVVPCEEYAYSTGRIMVKICPVCGGASVNGESLTLARETGAWWGNFDANATPEYAEIAVFSMPLPDGGVLYSIAMESCGLALDPDARIWVTVPSSAESVAVISGMEKVDFTYEDGVITLITDRAGLFLAEE